MKDKPALRVVDEADEHEADHERRAPRRRGERAAAGEDVASLLARAVAVSPALDDDAAWARRDAEIQVQRDRAAAEVERTKLDKRAKAMTDERELGDAALPLRAVECALAPSTLSVPMQVVAAWVPSDAKNILILSGECGIGKTAAAAWFALRSSYSTWRYAHAARFAAESKFNRDRREIRSRWGEGALILDDLGAEYKDNAGSFLVDLDELVDYFYARRRPMIITTNIPAEAFPGRYKSERLIQRIREAAVWREMGTAPCLRPSAPVKGGRR